MKGDTQGFHLIMRCLSAILIPLSSVDIRCKIKGYFLIERKGKQTNPEVLTSDFIPPCTTVGRTYSSSHGQDSRARNGAPRTWRGLEPGKPGEATRLAVGFFATVNERTGSPDAAITSLLPPP